MSQYRYALRLPNKYDMPESDRVWAPIFTSKSMSTDTPDTDITHAMIWAHGLAANGPLRMHPIRFFPMAHAPSRAPLFWFAADGYFCSGYTAAKTGGAPEGTVRTSKRIAHTSWGWVLGRGGRSGRIVII